MMNFLDYEKGFRGFAQFDSELSDNKDQFIISVPVPGVKQENIFVSLEEKDLLKISVKGDYKFLNGFMYKSTKESIEHDLILRLNSSASQRINKLEKIKLSLELGVLKITIPLDSVKSEFEWL